MKQIIQDNYKSIVKRGLITPETSSTDFIMKLEEEVQEYIEEGITNDETYPFTGVRTN